MAAEALNEHLSLYLQTNYIWTYYTVKLLNTLPSTFAQVYESHFCIYSYCHFFMYLIG